MTPSSRLQRRLFGSYAGACPWEGRGAWKHLLKLMTPHLDGAGVGAPRQPRSPRPPRWTVRAWRYEHVRPCWQDRMSACPGICNSTQALWLEAASWPACSKHQISAPLQDQKQVVRSSAFPLESSSASSKTLCIWKKKTYTSKTFPWPPSRSKKQSEERKGTIWTLTLE